MTTAEVSQMGAQAQHLVTGLDAWVAGRLDPPCLSWLPDGIEPSAIADRVRQRVLPTPASAAPLPTPQPQPSREEQEEAEARRLRQLALQQDAARTLGKNAATFKSCPATSSADPPGVQESMEASSDDFYTSVAGLRRPSLVMPSCTSLWQRRAPSRPPTGWRRRWQPTRVAARRHNPPPRLRPPRRLLRWSTTGRHGGRQQTATCSVS